MSATPIERLRSHLKDAEDAVYGARSIASRNEDMHALALRQQIALARSLLTRAEHHLDNFLLEQEVPS